MCCIKIVKIFKFKFQNQNNWLYVAREILYSQKCVPKLPMEILPGWGDSHMKMTGMLVGKLELNPKGDQSGRGSGVIWPLNETMLKQTTK